MANRTASFQITDAEGYPIGSKDTKTVTILDLDTTQRPGPGNTGNRFAPTWQFTPSSGGWVTTTWINQNKGQAHGGYVNVYDETIGGQTYRVLDRISVDGAFLIGDNEQFILFRDCVTDGGSNKSSTSGSRNGVGRLTGAGAHNVTNIIVEHCDLYNFRSAGILAENNWTVRYCRIHYTPADGIKSDGQNCHYHNNWLYDLGVWDGVGSNPHSDGFQIQGGGSGTILEYNFWRCPYGEYPPPNQTTRPLQLETDNGNTTNLIIRNNWIDGGGAYSCALDVSNGTYSGIQIVNNFFSMRVDPSGGKLFQSDHDFFSDSSSLLSGNRWDPDPQYVSNPAYQGKVIEASDDPDNDGETEGFAQE